MKRESRLDRNAYPAESGSMMRVWLVLFLTLSSMLRGEEELAVVSYHISKDEPVATLIGLVADGTVDPFSKETPPKLQEMKRLEAAPFESRFLSDGDVFCDATPYFDWIVEVAEGEVQAVLNESTGRLVVKGSEEQHKLVRWIAYDWDGPGLFEFDFILYQTPLAETLKEGWSLKTLPVEARKIGSVVREGKSGYFYGWEHADEGLRVVGQCYDPASYPVIGYYWQLFGSIPLEGEMITIETSSSSGGIDGMRRLIDLGSCGSKKNWFFLEQKISTKSPDGVYSRDLILDEDPGRSRFMEYFFESNGLVEMTPEEAENPESSQFFAVGAAHYTGKSAIQDLLTKKGYTITPAFK